MGVSKNNKINAAGQGKPKHPNAWLVPSFKTQRIGSEKTYCPKIHRSETRNCKKDETAVHCCDPALSVLSVMLVSRNFFHVVSALQSIVCLYIFFWLIRSFAERPYVGSIYRMRSLAVLVSHLQEKPQQNTFSKLLKFHSKLFSRPVTSFYSLKLRKRRSRHLDGRRPKQNAERFLHIYFNFQFLSADRFHGQPRIIRSLKAWSIVAFLPCLSAAEMRLSIQTSKF